MPGKAVGRAAVELPWLCPNTTSLIALADAPATVPGFAAADPGLALFLLRFAQLAPEPALLDFAPGALQSAFLPETAAAFLGATSAGVLPHVSFALEKVRVVAERAGTIAASLAEATRKWPAESAATVARLAPLGWYAALTVDPFTTAEPLNDPNFLSEPLSIQKDVWGLDHASITRRLAARWKLPACVATTISSLNHSYSVAACIVSHPDLFAIVQLAVLEAEKLGSSLGLSHGAKRSELLAHLQIDDSAVGRIASQCDELSEKPVSSLVDSNPHRVPLIRNLLRMAAESRRRNGHSLVARLEDQIDGLHAALNDMGELAGERLLAAKLEGLAELAAGAGHEINTPLAVISGNAQRLLRTEPDLERGATLRAIVRQAHRIAGILRELMQFARPPKAQIRSFPLADLLQGLRDEQAPFALEREVHLELQGAFAGIWIEGDLAQLRTGLGAVVRNGIEAASAGGWLKITCQSAKQGLIEIEVEDSGSGLSLEAIEHAFDPFYCGKSAGRGRGLGLPTAWQLIRQNGGDLRYQPRDGEPTCFVVTLNKSVEREILSLRSA